MATFDSIFPTFLAKCGELHTLLLSVAFALFVTGIIVTVHHRFSDKVLLHLLARILVLTSLLVFLPVWGNTIQNLLQTSIAQATENNRLQESKYANSTGTAIDRADARTLLFQAQINLEIAKADAGLAYYN